MKYLSELLMFKMKMQLESRIKAKINFMPKKLIPFALLLFFIHSSCYIGYSSGDELSQENWINSKNTLTIWALADIQPTNKGHEEAFEMAIKDINENGNAIHAVIQFLCLDLLDGIEIHFL